MTDNEPQVSGSVFEDSGQWAALDDVSTLGDTEVSGATSWYGWGATTPMARSVAGQSVGAAKRARSRAQAGTKAASQGKGRRTGGETARSASPSPSSAIVDLDEMALALDEARRKIDEIDGAQRDGAPRGMALPVGEAGTAVSPADDQQRPASSPSTPRIGRRPRGDYGSAPLGAFGVPSGGGEQLLDSNDARRRSSANATPETPAHPPPGLEEDVDTQFRMIMGPGFGPEQGGDVDDAPPQEDDGPPAAALAAAAWLRRSHPRYAQRLESQLLQRDDAARDAVVEASLQEVSRLRLRLRAMEREVDARNGGVRTLSRENRELSEQISAQSAQLDAMRARISSLHQQAMARRRTPRAVQAAYGSANGATVGDGADRGSCSRGGEAAKQWLAVSRGRTSPQRVQGSHMASIAHSALAARAATLRLRLARRRVRVSLPSLLTLPLFRSHAPPHAAASSRRYSQSDMSSTPRTSMFGVVPGTLPRGTAPTTVEKEGAEAVKALCSGISARRMMLLDAVRRHAKTDSKALTRDEFMALFSEFEALADDAAERAVVWKQVAVRRCPSHAVVGPPN